jgi:hypothetical protein
VHLGTVVAVAVQVSDADLFQFGQKPRDDPQDPAGIRPSHKRAIRTGPVLSSSGIMPRWHVQHLIILSFRRSPCVAGLSAQATTTPPAAPGTDKSSAARDQFGPLGSPPAETGDLLNVAKDLLVQVVTGSLRHRWSDGQLPADLAPQNAPHGRELTGYGCELCV